jgi:hypothetical protein
VRKRHRRQAVTSALIAAALEAAMRANAPALEAYPLDADRFAHWLRLNLRALGSGPLHDATCIARSCAMI